MDENKVRTNIILEKEMKAKLTELAKEDGRSFNNYVVTLLKKHIEEIEKG